MDYIRYLGTYPGYQNQKKVCLTPFTRMFQKISKTKNEGCGGQGHFSFFGFDILDKFPYIKWNPLKPQIYYYD